MGTIGRMFNTLS